MKATVLDTIFIAFIFCVFLITCFVAYLIFQNINATPQFSNQAGMTELQYVFSVFDYASVFIIIGLGIAAIIGAFMINAHPVFFIFSVILLAICLIVVTQFSNAFYVFASSEQFKTVAAYQFPIMTEIMKNFPIILTVIGFLIIIVIYSKTRGEQG